ncbi:hypothetical protein ILUMI_15557 [Ignelater luminosus]|uniref:Uncharacterized protein n=1 Tax=Ignelater luminosus TaxID=2038154 RepID=A0A8K0CS09_IGNLU|nr:hypothetical protein ILUMI_15557 [Ignelater luminosus]
MEPKKLNEKECRRRTNKEIEEEGKGIESKMVRPYTKIRRKQHHKDNKNLGTSGETKKTQTEVNLDDGSQKGFRKNRDRQYREKSKRQKGIEKKMQKN